MIPKNTVALACLLSYVLTLPLREHSDDEPAKGLEEMPAFLPAAGATGASGPIAYQDYGLPGSTGNLII